MRHTQPLSAEEERVDAAIRARGGSDSDKDRALTLYRMGCRRRGFEWRENIERVADLILGVRHDSAC